MKKSSLVEDLLKTDVAGFDKAMSSQIASMTGPFATSAHDIEESIADALKRHGKNDRKALLHMHLRLKTGSNAEPGAMTRHELAEMAEMVASKGAANTIIRRLANFYVRIAMLRARIEALRLTKNDDGMIVIPPNHNHNPGHDASKYETHLLAEYAKNEENLREKRAQNQRELDRIMHALFQESAIHPALTEDDLPALEMQVECIAERGCATQELRRLKITEALLEQRQLDAALIKCAPLSF